MKSGGFPRPIAAIRCRVNEAVALSANLLVDVERVGRGPNDQD
jgi:hypothetical protein